MWRSWACSPNRLELEEALEGWHGRCGRPASVEWLRERASVGAFTTV